MSSLFIVLCCSWGNPTRKSLVGVLKMRKWSLWRLLWVSPHYDKKQRIRFVLKLPKLLKCLLFPFPSSEHNETHQLHTTTPLHARPRCSFKGSVLLASLVSPCCTGKVPRASATIGAKEDIWQKMTLSLKEGKTTTTRKFYCPSRFTSVTDFDVSRQNTCSICLLQTVFVCEEC